MKQSTLEGQIQKAKKYYDQFDINEPTIHDWRQWLGTLPKNIASDFYEKGFSYSLKSLPFQAWYLQDIKGLKPEF